MPDFSIRAATGADVQAVHAIWYATETIGEPDPPPVGEPHPWLRHVLRAGTLLVAERDGAILGFAGVIERGNLVFLTDLFVEGRAVTVASRLAALLAALLSDLLVKSVPMRGLGGLTALTADILIELGPVLTFDGLAAFLAGFPNGHSAAGLLRWGRHNWTSFYLVFRMDYSL